MPPLPRLVLASGSKQRKDLLRDAGYDFIAHPADIDESAYPRHLRVTEVCLWLARRKAEIVSTQYPDDVVLAADTIVALGNEMLGKPIDATDARRMLGRLSGTTHTVATGVAVMLAAKGVSSSRQVISTVQMRSLTAREMDNYIGAENWAGKAGGYGIQDPDPFVTRISGSLSNIVGLPMDETIELLTSAGIPRPPTKPTDVVLGDSH